jgi:hypothetical protein
VSEGGGIRMEAEEGRNNEKMQPSYEPTNIIPSKDSDKPLENQQEAIIAKKRSMVRYWCIQEVGFFKLRFKKKIPNFRS